MDAVDAGDVAGGRDHPALAAADDHRPVGEGGVVALLDRRVESVAVEMCDGEPVELGVGDEPRAAAMRTASRSRRSRPEAIAAEGGGLDA